jgi:hypothetical protein
MAAPAYTWEFVCDLWGDRVPKKVTLEATADLETKVGTLVFMSSGQVDNAGASAASLLGIAAEETAAALSAADPIQVYLIAPGMVIRGTADADASALQGFTNKTIDLNADGSLDVGDTSNGCLSVYRVNNSAGTEVDCVITEFDMGCVN